MYMHGERYFPGHDEKHPRAKDALGAEITSQEVHLGYWRKHPNLHGFIVETFGGGKDECQKIELCADDVRKILEAVRANKLPDTEGFFFGASETADEQDTIPKLEAALAWLDVKEPGVWKSLYYRASW